MLMLCISSHRLLSPASLREAITENLLAPSLLLSEIIHAHRLCTQMTELPDIGACPQALLETLLTLPLLHHCNL
jgi:hypothetical protein